MSSPSSIDQGLLSVLNSVFPSCPANNDYAAWASGGAKLKTVAKGVECGNGYIKLNPNSVQPSGLAGNQQYDVCATIGDTTLPSEDLTRRLTACATAAGSPIAILGTPSPSRKSPGPAPKSPPPAPASDETNPWWNPTGLPLWALTLIFAIVLILIVGGAGYMMTRNKPVNLK